MLSYNRLPVISPTKVDFFGISKELQFWFSSHCKTDACTQQKRKRTLPSGGQGVGTATQSVQGFSLAALFPSLTSVAKLPLGKKRESFFLLLGSAVFVGDEGFPFWPPDSILNEASVYYFSTMRRPWQQL